MAHEINPEQDNPLVELGRIFHEYFYRREKKEVSLEGMKIDLLKKGEENYIICEVKKSSRFELSAKMQLAYSIYKLREKGIDVKGELLIPKERKRIEIELDEDLEREIRGAVTDIGRIMSSDKPPSARKTRYCRGCAYRYFCWA